MLVDYEAVLADLEAYTHTRTSHGQRDLLHKISELRTLHRVPEGFLDRAFRLMGVRVTREPLTSIVASDSADGGPAGASAMSRDDGHRSPQDGGSNARNNRSATG